MAAPPPAPLFLAQAGVPPNPNANANANAALALHHQIHAHQLGLLQHQHQHHFVPNSEISSPFVENAAGATSGSGTGLTGVYAETRSVTLEWKLTGLKAIFDSTKGESKSKVIKSALFDSARWQIYFYPNSGNEQFTFVDSHSLPSSTRTHALTLHRSLYLSCEPTPAERELGLLEQSGNWATNGGTGASGGSSPPRPGVVVGSNGARLEQSGNFKGPWRREEKVKFTFEAKSLDKRLTFKTMEANDHSFSDSARNWGYANFWKRQDAYYNNATVRAADGFLLLCTIVYSPTLPSPPPLPRLLIPKDLVNSYASLFNDPDYSDVVFRIVPPATSGNGRRREKRLYAARKILMGRCEYFETMFGSGFEESTATSAPIVERNTPTRRNGSENGATQGIDRESAQQEEEEEDSDTEDDWDEDDDSDMDVDSEELEEEEEEIQQRMPASATVSDAGIVESEISDGPPGTSTPSRRNSSTAHSDAASTTFVDAPHSPVRPPRAPSARQPTAPTTTPRRHRTSHPPSPPDNRPRYTVVVTDSSYATYKAFLQYLYTDSITFAPLSSSYLVAKEAAQLSGKEFPWSSRNAYLKATTPVVMGMGRAEGAEGRASAKAIYRLADKIGLVELRNRAFEWVIKSLSVQNVPYEVFGGFAQKFDEVRAVELAFLLEKWPQIRSSPSMLNVITNVRSGRFPGFEEVWTAILGSLDVRPGLVGLGAEEERVGA